MALFRILWGNSARLTQQPKHEGYCYVTTDDGKFYVDITKDYRIALNAKTADYAGKLINASAYYNPLLAENYLLSAGSKTNPVYVENGVIKPCDDLSLPPKGNNKTPIYIDNSGQPQTCVEFLPTSGGTMKGPLVLTQNKNYGDTAPITGETGQIYFIPDEDRYLPITGGRMEGAFCLTEGIGFGNSVPSSGQDGQLYFVPGGSSSGIQAIQLSGQVTGASLVSDGIATITTNFSINKDLSLNTKKITNLGTPTAGNDAATKSYVDSAIANAYNMSSLAEQGIMTLEEPMIGSSQRNYFATIGLDWTRTGDIFYQIVKIPGITINDMPIIDSNISSINPSVIRTQLYDFSNIFRAVTDTDSITFYSLQPSTEKIPIKVMVI